MEQQKLPNATAVLVLGILSLFGCCFYGLPGIVLGIIALVLAKKDMALYREAPDNYSNYSNLNIGRILAIIGLVLSVFFLIYLVYIISIIGFENFRDPEAIQRAIEEMMGQ